MDIKDLQKKPKQKRLKNGKHETFVSQIVKGDNHSDAYRKAYPHVKDVTANVNSYKLLQRPDVQNRLLTLLTQSYTDEDIKNDIETLRHATTGIYHNGKLVAREPNHQIRFNNLRLYLQLRGDLNTDGSINKTTINVQNNVMLLDRLGDKIDKFLDKFSDSSTDGSPQTNKNNLKTHTIQAARNKNYSPDI